AGALPGQLDRPLDVVLGHLGGAGLSDGLAQRPVLARAETLLRGQLRIGDVAGADALVEALGADPRAGHQRRDLLLLDHLPVDVVLDVRVIDVDDHHLGRAPGGAAALDRPGGPIADPQEAHQAARAPAARQRLTLATDPREVRAGARAVLEQPGLADPQIHDAAVADQIVGHALDEARVRLRVL